MAEALFSGDETSSPTSLPGTRGFYGRLQNQSIFAKLLIAIVASVSYAAPAISACDVDGTKPQTLQFTGLLQFTIFPGAPNFEDVRKGDMPEPAYILKLDRAICASNMQVADEPRHEVSASTIQILSDHEGELRQLKGRHVLIQGKDIAEAYTGHHHAPLMMGISKIGLDREGVPGEGPPAATVVQAFYMALHEGDGEEAARFVLPGKRKGGLSSNSMSRFYGSLYEPLSLRGIRPLNTSDFEVTYRFKASVGSACDGRAIVSTRTEGGVNYVTSIHSVSGC